MISITRDKWYDLLILNNAIIAAGLPIGLVAPARFYGSSYDGTPGVGVTTVWCFSDLTAGERTTIEGILDA